MPTIIEITDLSAPELAVYTRLTEAQLRNKLEPEKGIFIAESPKVIGTALDAGCVPLSFLMERPHIEGSAAAVLARVDAWAVVANTPQGAAGPLAPVLGEYFDMVPLLGRQVAAVSPNGLPLAVGVFAGLDIWGRATIKTDAGEQEFPPEAVRIRGL